VGLDVLVEGDPSMFNPYGVIAVNPARYQRRELQGRDAVHRVAHGPGGPARDRDFKVNGEQLSFRRPVMRGMCAAVSALALALPCAADELRLGATHTLEDSGVLRCSSQAFTRATRDSRAPTRRRHGPGDEVRGQRRRGHRLHPTARKDEEALVARGIGAARADVMWNDFVIAGPAADPARIRGEPLGLGGVAPHRRAPERGSSRATTIRARTRRSWSSGLPRAGSGNGRANVSAGQGAARTLMVASEMDAYDLVDRATLKQLAARFPAHGAWSRAMRGC
jgi:tungstate transport system substrate-binding protein